MNYPTGYSPTDLPFYDELDVGRFEQFCTDLLNLNPTVYCLRQGRAVPRRIVGANRLLSGRPQKGADIRAEADGGEVWYFQCKHVKSFGPSEVSEAIQLAETGFPQADQFVLVTTCGLSEESLSQGDIRGKWQFWDPSKLTTETLKIRPREGAINLVHRFFGLAWKKKLFPCGDQLLLRWEEFFAPELASERTEFHHRTSFVPWGDAPSKLEGFAREGAGKALILSAPGGQGKSRLLLELARKLEEEPGAPRVRFLNLNSHGLGEEQSDFLAREEGDLLLIVDDAHRLDAVIEDVARAASRAKSVRLLIATRPQAVEKLRSQLYGSGYAERTYEVLSLPRWNSGAIHALAEGVLKPEHKLQAPQLAELADRCPLLVILGSGLINAGAWVGGMAGTEAFREKVFRSFKEDFLNRQAAEHRERTDQLIRFLSFVSPTANDERLRERAAKVLGCTALAVADDLDRLQAAGMVVENREGIRLYPDLFADAVLLAASVGKGGRLAAFFGAVVNELSARDFPALMRNLAQADWVARATKRTADSIFDPVWTEFVRRFETGQWKESEQRILPWKGGEVPDERAPEDRFELLNQWASFAVFLPERTFELAELALRNVGGSGIGGPADTKSNLRRRVSNALVPLLNPLVISHPQHAVRALDLLWTLDAEEPKSDWQKDSNAIAAIAAAASFDFHRPLAVSRTVMEWLEVKLQQEETVDRIRKQPWLLSALLKPFFGREVEQKWSTGRTLHLRSAFVSAERTRDLRQKALAIADRFLHSPNPVLARSAIPVVSEALQPLYGRFGNRATEQDQEAWRQDRLEAAKAIERGLQVHRDSSVLLLQLRGGLLDRCHYDPDENVRLECARILSQMPDTFELRVGRIMTSFADLDLPLLPGMPLGSDESRAEAAWTELRRKVAIEATQRFPTPRELCDFIGNQVRELEALQCTALGAGFLDMVAEISIPLCSALLEELMATKDETLDRFLYSVLAVAVSKTPDTYEEAVVWLPSHGRPAQVCALVHFLGRTSRLANKLAEFERQAILRATERTDEAVVQALASYAGYLLDSDPQWATQILIRLSPVGERDKAEVLRVLAHFARSGELLLTKSEVARCLANLGDRCLSGAVHDQRHLKVVAEKFPRQMYEQLLELAEHSAQEAPARDRFYFGRTVPLGRIPDDAYIAAEVSRLWRKMISEEFHGCESDYPLDFMRILLWSNVNLAPSLMEKLASECSDDRQILLVAKLAAAQGPRFIFDFPDLVRALLVRSQALKGADFVREELRRSAGGGGRLFTENELAPEYRYILEQGEDFANRYASDPVLGDFYRMIAKSERQQLESHRRDFAAMDESG